MPTTAQKEFDQKRKQFRSLQTPEEKQTFYQNLLKELDQKSETEHVAGLLALKEAVRKSRLMAEGPLTQDSSLALQIFPNSKEESVFLQSLLDRLSISYQVKKV